MSKLALVIALACAGCFTYTAVAPTSDGKVVVAKNGLFGHWIYICNSNVTGCRAADAP
ncbi:MAG TPA: hypothetical protein VGG28_04645 [Kofleriaceae bacterium]|jgi:hypothetical protein